MWVFKCRNPYLGYWPWMHWCKFSSTPVSCCKSTVPTCVTLAPPLPLLSLNPPSWSQPINPTHIWDTNWARDDTIKLELFLTRLTHQFTHLHLNTVADKRILLATWEAYNLHPSWEKSPFSYAICNPFLICYILTNAHLPFAQHNG
jgi:hypothetical protein